MQANKKLAAQASKVVDWNFAAGWSSSVARRAHNPEVVGSNPAPATTCKNPIHWMGFFTLWTTSANKKNLF